MSPEQAWQATLRNEYAAVYGYGIVGGRLGPEVAAAQRALAAHQERRDHCIERLLALGAEPEPAAAGYDPATPVRTDAQARALAVDIERTCSAGYLDLVAQLDARTRRAGTGWLQDSAIQQTLWSGRPPALPGFAL